MFPKVGIEHKVDHFPFLLGFSRFLIDGSRPLLSLFLLIAQFNLVYDGSIVTSGEECHLFLSKRSQKGIPVRVKLIIMSQLGI